MRASTAAWIIFLVTAFTAAPVGAQDSIASYWDRIAALNDVRAVRAHADEAPASSELYNGLALTRIYQLTQSEVDGKAAEEAVERLVKEQPRNAWVQFAYGQVLAIRNPRRFPMRAGSYLRQALALDSLHVPAAVALSRLALYSREEDLLRAAERAGSRIIRHGAHPELLNLLSEIAREKGDNAASRQHAAAASAAGSARALYNLAIAQLADPAQRAQGYNNYLASADLRDPEVDSLIMHDLKLVGAESELPDLDGAGTKPSAALIRFWGERSRRDARTPDERVSEHYRRIAHAREKFAAKFSNSFDHTALYWRADDNRGYDDRGMVYIRYGEPTEVIRSTIYDTWLYELPGRDPLVFHFMRPFRAGSGYILTEVPRCAAGWFADRTKLGGEYMSLATKCATGAPAYAIDAVLNSLRTEYRAQTEIALTRDAFAWIFENPLDVAVDVYAFRSKEGRSEYVTSIAVAAEPELRASDGTYPLQIRLFAGDSVHDQLFLLDTTVVYHPDRVPGPNDGLRTFGTIRLDTAYAPYYRLAVISRADSTRGVSVGGDLPTYLNRGFGISDIMFADTLDGGTFERGRATLNLIPAGAFPSAAFRLFYEVYGLAPGSEYETSIRISPIRDGVIGRLTPTNSVTLTFKSRVDDPDGWRQQELRTIETALDRGDYRLTIELRNTATGELVIKNKEFRITGR